VADVSVPAAPRRPFLAGRGRLLREVVRRPEGAVGLFIVLALLVIVIFAPMISPYDYTEQNITDRLQGPSLSHPLGTDELGRDLLSRLLYGTRVALGVAVPAVLGALAVGLVIGMVAGYVGGKIDNVLLVVMDTLQAFPAVILALAMLAVLGPSLRNVIIVIVISFAPQYARVVRALVLATKQNPYVEAERSLGASDLRITAIHILPNITPPLFILVAMDIPSAIVVEAGLSFLGVGVQPPTPSWGVILSDGFDRVRDTPWPVIFAGLAIMITTLGFTMLGETVRDIVDPRLSGLRRWRRP
jgi:peptide/nickel transport system permease protein